LNLIVIILINNKKDRLLSKKALELFATLVILK